MKKVFLTFADTRMKNSLNRILRQAESLNYYNEIIGYNELDIDPVFLNHFKPHLTPGSKGYGYWCWKPQIILQILNSLDDGDIIQYTDAGCHLNSSGQKRLEEYFNIASDSKSGLLAFQAFPPKGPLSHDGRQLLDLSEYKWVKGDLLDYLGVRENESILTTQTIGAGIIFIRKCSSSMSILREWLNVLETNFSLIDDTPSNSINLDGFIEHRHDQSIFSLLCKLNNVETVSAYEYWYPGRHSMKPDWEALKNFPIHAKRDKDFGIKNKIESRIKKLKYNFKRALRKLKP
jgi:hypothetical protein